MFSYGPLHMGVTVLADQLVLNNNSSVQTLDVVWEIYLERWMLVWMEVESGKSLLAAWVDDVDDDDGNLSCRRKTESNLRLKIKLVSHPASGRGVG